MRGQCGVLPWVDLARNLIWLILDLSLWKLLSEEQVGMAGGQRKHHKFCRGWPWTDIIKSVKPTLLPLSAWAYQVLLSCFSLSDPALAPQQDSHHQQWGSFWLHMTCSAVANTDACCKTGLATKSSPSHEGTMRCFALGGFGKKHILTYFGP